MVALVLQYAVMNNKQEKQIETLTREGAQKDIIIAELRSEVLASANPIIDK